MMNNNEARFVRIVDAYEKGAGLTVTFYRGDALEECAWQGAAPKAGAVYEITDNGFRFISESRLPMRSADDAVRWRVRQTDGKSRMQILRARAAIRGAARRYFDQAGFIEMDAPLLVHGATPDPAVESFPVDDRYLVSSTEYQLKRLYVGGFEKLYSLTQNFRPGDISAARNPEFTMLEWGRAGARMAQIEQDAELFVKDALGEIGVSGQVQCNGLTVDLSAAWDHWSVAEAVERLTGVQMKSFDAADCLAAARGAGVVIKKEWEEDRDFLFSLTMEALQPRLGASRPVFISDWPIYQTTSAAAKDDGLTVDRSELFVGGIELADGFAGLADPAMQEQLFAYALSVRGQTGQDPVTIDRFYIEAMKSGAPFGAGMAMGFDRLVMLLTGQSEIRNVLAFAWDEV